MTDAIDETLKSMEYNPADNTEVIELHIPDDAFLTLALMAHERDITFNHLITAILKEKVERK